MSPPLTLQSKRRKPTSRGAARGIAVAGRTKRRCLLKLKDVMVTIDNIIHQAKAMLAVGAMLCAPSLAGAATTFTQDGLTYTVTSTRSKEVSVKQNDYTLTSVTIPATVTYGNTTYKVTSIEEYGFTKKCTATGSKIYDSDVQAYYDEYEGATYWGYKVSRCKDGTTDEVYQWSTEYLNSTLKAVTFELPSNVTTISAHAFEACDAIEELVIPNSVTELGFRSFYCCTSLKRCLFQTRDDGTTGITEIPDYAFSHCHALESIELPEGITSIGYSSFQFDFGLLSIKLPNTLTKIGNHFLCCCSSIKSVTIPASVTDISAAAFHGCESLESVYLLGTASALSLTDAANGANSFSANEVYCKGKVTNCTFYVTSDNLASYESTSDDNIWAKVDGTYKNGESIPNSDGNDIVAIDNKREFTGGKWVTAIFPDEVELTKFGSGTMAATMEKATVSEDDPHLYHVTFKCVDGEQIPAETPLMFYPAQTTSYELYSIDKLNDQSFKLNMTNSFKKQVSVDDGAVVTMIGRYTGEALSYLDFYYSGGKFYRVPEGKSVALGNFRCYWKIDVDNVKSGNAKGFSYAWDADGSTAISGVEAEPARVTYDVYDLGGRRVATGNMPSGLYIINGKKVLVK